MTDEEVIGRIASVPPQHAAILPSEMLLFCRTCLNCGVRHVIESGRKYGYSTEVLCQFAWQVSSIECSPERESDARLSRYGNLEMIHGLTEHVLKQLFMDRPTAVLLDGPKGLVALSIMKKLWKSAAVWAVHDVYCGTKIRDELGKYDGFTFSDDPVYLSQFGAMDMAALQLRGYTSHSELLPVGNVLGVVCRGQAKEDLL